MGIRDSAYIDPAEVPELFSIFLEACQHNLGSYKSSNNLEATLVPGVDTDAARWARRDMTLSTV